MAPLQRLHHRFDIAKRAATGIALVVALTGLLGFAPTSTAAEAKHFAISLVNGAVVGASNTIRVKQGDDVELRWSSDKPMELHLHGYDIEVKVAPGAPAVMSFNAKIPGRFPIEPHGQEHGRRRGPVVYLEVLP
jgi:FtsP/CotA-like multicopper oxidase with cupredoxin domain